MPKTDCNLIISVGRSRDSKKWKIKELLWSEIVARISKVHRTVETFKDYESSPKSRRDEIKDVGGFVGGPVLGGQRKKNSVLSRTLVTLDIDEGKKGDWELLCLQLDSALAYYTTHSHSPEKPRYRLLIPLTREVNAEEYEAIARKIAELIDIERFDNTGFQMERLMYWPSCSKDGIFEYKVQKGPILAPEAILSLYYDWTDASQWPVSSKVKEAIKRGIRKKGDPLEKPGIVGAFCRAFSIQEAIEKFLPEIYEEAENERYTFKEGSTTGGLVVYEDKFAYSHHGTDPVSGTLCNAFDLVRIHLYGILDEESDPKTSINHRPSFLAMREEALKEKKVRKLIGQEKLDRAKNAFDDMEFNIDNDGNDEFENTKEEKGKWLEDLEMTEKAEIKCTVDNCIIILENDASLKDRICLNEFNAMRCLKKAFKWNKKGFEKLQYFSDSDEAHLRHYFERVYNIVSKSKIEDAIEVVSIRNRFHPVRDYLNSLSWDGINRLDSVLIDFMGAEDNRYTRAVTRKWFVAAVARIFEPGCKFDYMLCLAGEQGARKSMFFDIIGGEWFNESFSFSMIGKKEAAEQLNGSWIIEVAELAGLKKTEVQAVKKFLAQRKDEQRNAFKHFKTLNKRQCIFGGNYNEDEPFRDVTGNRRFWPVQVTRLERLKEFKTIRNQLWAEALHYYKEGEELFLSEELEADAKAIQILNTEKDSRLQELEKLLDIPITTDWDKKTLWEKREFLSGEYLSSDVETRQRKIVSATEIWLELFGGQLKDFDKSKAREINDMMHFLINWEFKLLKSKGKVFRGFKRKPAFLQDAY